MKKAPPNRTSRRALMEAVRASGSAKATAGPNAARSQDFLYDSEGVDEGGAAPAPAPHRDASG